MHLSYTTFTYLLLAFCLSLSVANSTTALSSADQCLYPDSDQDVHAILQTVRHQNDSQARTAFHAVVSQRDSILMKSGQAIIAKLAVGLEKVALKLDDPKAFTETATIESKKGIFLI
jgi:hypothetical protein